MQNSLDQLDSDGLVMDWTPGIKKIKMSMQDTSEQLDSDGLVMVWTPGIKQLAKRLFKCS